MTQKTETKLALAPNGEMVKTEVPVIDTPTELKMINFRVAKNLALGDYIPVSEKTKGGIIVPEYIQKDNALKAILIDVGREFDSDYKVGDMVIFKAGTPVMELDGKKYLVLQEFHIVGKYEKK